MSSDIVYYSADDLYSQAGLEAKAYGADLVRSTNQRRSTRKTPIMTKLRYCLCSEQYGCAANPLRVELVSLTN